MSTPAVSSKTSVGRRRYFIGVMLMFVVAIANVDRINMFVAAPVLQNKFHLSDGLVGLVLSSFFWGYSPFLPFAGWLLDRCGKALVLGLAVFAWTLASSAMFLVNGLLLLFTIRILLGV